MTREEVRLSVVDNGIAGGDCDPMGGVYSKIFQSSVYFALRNGMH